MTLPPPRDQNLQRQRLRRMQWLALGLLVLAGAVFALAHGLAGRHPAWGYVAAFAEAAMVGALADWFAVTALFRHPLGLPIWHTAIIPRRKDEVAASLGRFVEGHFLTTGALVARIRAADPAARLAAWVFQPGHAARLGLGLAEGARLVLQNVDDARIAAFLRDTVRNRLAEVDLSTAAGALLEDLARERKHQALLDALLDGSITYLAEPAHEPQVSRLIIEALNIENRYLAAASNALSPRIADALRHKLEEVRGAPEHPWRAMLDTQVQTYVARLHGDPEWRASIARQQAQALAHPQVAAWLEGLWCATRERLLAELAAPGGALAGRLGDAALRLGQRIMDDNALRDWLNDRLVAAIPPLVEQNRGKVAAFIETQIEAWSREEMSERIELAIGRDLQFIRINGTLVGGCVGLAIHALTQALA